MTKQVTILYVDDEEVLRILVSDQLANRGFNVETADDGDTALEILEKKQFDMILLDIRMPRMNGIEVLKMIRKRKIASRVIVLTAVSDLAVAIEARATAPASAPAAAASLTPAVR